MAKTLKNTCRNAPRIAYLLLVCMLISPLISADDWAYKKEITINGGNAVLTNFTALMNVSFVTGKMDADFSDIRFYDGSCSGAKTTELVYYPISITNSKSALFRVKIPSLGINATGATICMYYNNPSIGSTKDGVNIFDKLVAYYPFEEGTGGNITSTTGVDNCSLTASTGWVDSGIMGKAYNFAGSIVADCGSSVNLDNAFMGNASYNYSYLFHTNYTGLAGLANFVISKGDTNPFWAVYFSEFSLYLSLSHNAAYMEENFGTQPTGWGIYAFTQAGNTRAGTNGYRNGTKMSSASISDNLDYIPNTAASLKFNNNPISAKFNGYLDEVIIINDIWSGERVKREFDNFNLSNIVFGDEQVVNPPPSLNITYPLNITYTYNVSNLNYTSNGVDCWYSRNGGATNSTTSPVGTNFTGVTSIEGSNTWTLYCNDSSNNLNSTSVTFYKDSIPPVVSIIYPLNATYSYNVSAINYSSSGEYCWYSLYGIATNSTIVPCGANFTSVISIEGSNIWTLYSNDSYGNLNYTSVTFFKDTTPPNITFLSQVPQNITSYNVYTSKLNITYNITDVSGLANVYYYSKTNETTTEIWQYINGTQTVQGYVGLNERVGVVITNISSEWNAMVSSNLIYPSVFNLDPEVTGLEDKLIYKLDSASKYFKIKFYNLTKNSYGTFNFMANTSGTGDLQIYFCNETYLDDLSVGCGIVANFPATKTFNYSLSNKSLYQFVPFSMNLTESTIAGIKVTNTNYFLLKRASIGVWSIYYSPTVARPDTTQLTTNGGINWANFDGTVQAFVSQYTPLNYTNWEKVCSNDSLGNYICSAERGSPISEQIQTPTIVSVYSPVTQTYKGNITINYTSSEVPTGLSFYNISLEYINHTFVKTIITNNSLNLGYIWNSVGTSDGLYMIRVEAVGNNNLSSYGYSAEFTVDNTPPGIIITYPLNATYNVNVSELDYSNASLSWRVGHAPSAYYKFNEVSGNASDSSGHNLTWTINDSIGSYIAGKLSNAGFASGGGINAFERAGSSAFDFELNNFTIAFWFRRANTAGGDIIFGSNGGATWYTIIVDSNMAFVRDPIVKLKGTSAVCDNNWHRVIMVRRGIGTGESELWIDGINEVNGTITNDMAGSILFYWASHVSTDFDTGLDDLGIWNDYAFTNTDIAADWNGGIGREQDILGGGSCWYSRDNGLSNSTTVPAGTNFINVVSTEGSNTWTLYCNDSMGNENSTSVTFYKDTTIPNAVLLSPVNNTKTTTTSQNFTSNLSDNLGIANATLYVYNQTGIYNQTNTSFASGILTKTLGIVVYLVDNVYNWFVTVWDWVGNGFTTGNYTILIDSTAPVINLTSPANNTYTTNPNVVLSANVTDAGIGVKNTTLYLYNLTSLRYIYSYSLENLSSYVPATGGLALTDGEYNWSYDAYDALDNHGTTHNFTLIIDTIYPLISYGIGTLADGVNVSQDNVYINTTWTEANFANITFYLYNITGLYNSSFYSVAIYSYNFTPLIDNYYWYNVTICDKVSYCNYTPTRMILIHATPPTAQQGTTTSGGGFVPFVNKSFFNNATQNFTANVTDVYGIQNVTITITNITGGNVTSTQQSGGILKTFFGFITTLADGIYTWFVKAFDNVGNFVQTNVLTFFIDTTPPAITSQNYTIALADFNDSYVHKINATMTDLYLNKTGVNFNGINYSVYNISSNIYEYNFTISLTHIPYSSSFYFWGIDNATNYAQSTTYYFNVNCPAGAKVFNNTYCVERITFAGNENKTRYLNISSSIFSLINAYINLSGNATYPINVSLYAGNTKAWSYTPEFNHTNNRTDNFATYINSYLESCSYIGGYCYVPFVFHSDTAGILEYSDLTWDNIGFIENSQTYNAASYPGSFETFVINFTYDTGYYTSVSGNLNYNGVDYAGVISGSGTTKLLTATITIPGLNTNISYPFYWNISMTNSSGTEYFKSKNYSQAINSLDMRICGGSYNVSFINFTIKDSEAVNTLVKSKFKSTFFYGQNSTKINYTYQELTEGNSSFAFCFNVSGLNYTISSKIEYEATGYAKNYYYINNMILTNATTNISLYLLNASKATVTQLKVQDDSQKALPDVYISIQKYYTETDTFFTVGMAKTDFNGQDIAYLNWYDTFYRYSLVRDGVVIYSTSTSKIDTTPVLFTVPKNYISGYKKFENLDYSLTYNNITENFILTYNLPSGEIASMCLKVIRSTFINDTIICNKCETSSSATIYCPLAGLQNGTYTAQIYATGSIGFIDALTIFKGTVNKIYNEIGNADGTIYAILFGLVILGMFLVSPALGVLGVILGIVGSMALGFQPLNYTELVGIVTLGVVIMIILKR